MKPLPNFFLTNRSLLDHHDLKKDRSRQLAWVYILGRCNFETGRVNLTEVYRELTDMFTYSKWRSFLDFLKKNEMLEDFQEENRGYRAGHQMTASVKNWFKYQGENSKNHDRANSRAATEQAQSKQQSKPSINTGEKEGKQQSKHSASVATTTEQTAESYKEVFIQRNKEVKEAKLEAFLAFEKIHPNYAQRLSQGRDFDFEHWLEYWGDEALRKLLKLAVENSNGSPQSVGNTWYWYIIGDRVAKNVTPISVKAKDDDYWEQVANLPEPKYVDFDEWLAKN